MRKVNCQKSPKILGAVSSPSVELEAATTLHEERCAPADIVLQATTASTPVSPRVVKPVLLPDPFASATSQVANTTSKKPPFLQDYLPMFPNVPSSRNKAQRIRTPNTAESAYPVNPLTDESFDVLTAVERRSQFIQQFKETLRKRKRVEPDPEISTPYIRGVIEPYGPSRHTILAKTPQWRQPQKLNQQRPLRPHHQPHREPIPTVRLSTLQQFHRIFVSKPIMMKAEKLVQHSSPQHQSPHHQSPYLQKPQFLTQQSSTSLTIHQPRKHHHPTPQAACQQPFHPPQHPHLHAYQNPGPP